MPPTHRLRIGGPVLAALALLLPAACGGSQASTAQASGTYHGPNELDFLITSPVRRQMPPERHNGSAEVVSDDGAEVLVELRMLEGGDVCEIRATRPSPGASTLTVPAGQECRSRFSYEGAPTAAVVTIEEGTVDIGSGTLRVDLHGSFVAATSGASQSSGIAEWEFEGTR
ncbi:MAG TPA: hypothetical protein RMH99_01425 [Sandaracinaceae bacterium LLY-WYZ-13_1]|nr:hypothetical protein [Sandaracinaceae bacterium LLY-WYZ-13_1]